MKYEKTPLVKPLATRKFALKVTTDMSKLSTPLIVLYLFKRHHLQLLILVTGMVIGLSI